MKSDRNQTNLQWIILIAVILPLIVSSGCTETRKEIVAPVELDPTLQLQVVSTYPSNGAIGPFSIYVPSDEGGYTLPHFIVQFNMPVVFSQYLPTAITCRMSDGRQARVSSTTSAYSRIVAFRLYDPEYSTLSYRKNITATVTIDTTLLGANGKGLPAPYSFTFNPEPYFRVSGVYPYNHAIVSYTTSSLRVQFNNTLSADILSHIHVTPTTGGTTHFINNSTGIQYSFPDHLKMDTTYTIVVDQDARDIDSAALPAQFRSSFTTLPFQVSYIYPSNGTTAVSMAAHIDIGFNGIPDTTSIREGLIITPPIQYAVSWYQGSSYVEITPSTDLAPSTMYTIRATNMIHSTSGSRLRPDTTVAFTTDKFRVTSTYWGSNITIYFSGRIKTPLPQNGIHFSPAIPGTFSVSTYYPFVVFSPQNPLARGKYTGTVETTVQSRAGYNLTEPYVFTFDIW